MPARPCRRQFLRAAGVSLAVPTLESARARGAAAPPPKRFIAVCTTLGIHAPNLIPAEAGVGHAPTPYLEVLRGFRDRLTVFSGLSHPDVDGGHSTEASFLTAAPHPAATNFRNSVSLDQFAAEKLHPDTRFPYLALAARFGSLSYARGGVQVPSEGRPSALFSRLFVTGSPREVAEQTRRLRDGRSVMDTVLDQANRARREAGAADRARLDQYFTAVREVEQRLASAQQWATRPKPVVGVPLPDDIADLADTLGRTRLMFDLAHLAFQTDSTRLITLFVDSSGRVPPLEGVTTDHHNLSHHGQDPEKLRQLRLLETRQMECVRDFLAKLDGSAEGGGSLLDRTAVLYGSNLGNASSHDTRNLPVLLAGGGFRHAGHLPFDRANNTPLANLFVSVLQHLGVEADRFASGTGRLTGLELA